MTFYVSRFTGVGSREDPFRPVVADFSEGWSMIDLRPDAAVPDGWALVWTPFPVSGQQDGWRAIASTNDEPIGAVLRRLIEQRLGVDDLPAGITLRQLVRRLLTVDGGPGRWNRIRPRGDGEYEIVLGELVDRWRVGQS